MKIYFAGAIRGGRELVATYREIICSLREFGDVMTEHVGDPNVGPSGESTPDELIFERNLKSLRGCDVVVADVSHPSLGVGYEIAFAEQQEKPILCLCNSDALLSAMIAGNPALSVHRYASTADIRQHIGLFFGRS